MINHFMMGISFAFFPQNRQETLIAYNRIPWLWEEVSEPSQIILCIYAHVLFV